MECLKLNGNLQVIVKKTAAFSRTQKKIEEKGEQKSTEIAHQTQEACKELSARISELEVVEFKGNSAQENVAVKCEYKKTALSKCLQGLQSNSDILKEFETKNCSPEAVTTSPTVKKAISEETAEAPVVPIIPDVLKGPPAATK